MKPIKDIIAMLVSELLNFKNEFRFIEKPLLYYNEALGDTSFLLAGLLDSLLKKNFSDWDKSKWIDDSLLTTISLKDNKVQIGGVMIWGINDTTEQWTEPFSFKVELLEQEKSFNKLTILFSDLDRAEISYEVFKDNRNSWAVNTDRNWRYSINLDRSTLS